MVTVATKLNDLETKVEALKEMLSTKQNKMEIVIAGNVKAGIVFRVKSVGVSKDDMQGYSLILQKVTTGAAAGNLRVFLYKYGAKNGTNVYMGDFGFSEEKTRFFLE